MRPRLPRSLFGRLVLANLAIIFAVAVALPLVLSRMLSDTANNFVSARLDQEAVAFMHGQPGRSSAIRGHEHLVSLVDEVGVVVVARPRPLPFTLAEVNHSRKTEFGQHGRFDVLSRPVRLPGGGRGWIIVALDRTRPEELVDDVVRSFLRRFVWVIAATLLMALATSLLLFRRVTGAFRRAAAEADGIGTDRFDARIDPACMPSEAVPLVRATNSALDRLEAGYRAQGDFVGNVAHELRTPLALISLRVEQLPASPSRDQMESAIGQANHVIRQLMDLAAIDRVHPQLAPIDPCEVMREAVEAMVPIVFRSGRSIAFEEPEARPPAILGVAELIVIALRNLIDNAVRHTPVGSSIVASVGRDGALVVEDDGPGLSVDARDPAKRRFRRGDTARSDSAGLGLSIVERIIVACGGTLETGRGAMGGARLILHPCPAPVGSA